MLYSRELVFCYMNLTRLTTKNIIYVTKKNFKILIHVSNCLRYLCYLGSVLSFRL